jgi:hypothetical protein
LRQHSTNARDGLSRYSLDIYEHREGQERLRAQREGDFPDEQAALAWAKTFYDDLARDVPLARFVLYEGVGRDRSRLRLVVDERRALKG